MRKLVVAVIAAILLLVGVLSSSAYATSFTLAQATSIIKIGFAQQIKARMQLSGVVKYRGSTVKCAAIAVQQWTCYATYTGSADGVTYQYGIYINATDASWKTVGTARLVREW